MASALSRRNECTKQDLEMSISVLLMVTTEWWEEVKIGYNKNPYAISLFSKFEEGKLPLKFTIRGGLIYNEQRLLIADHGGSKQKVL